MLLFSTIICDYNYCNYKKKNTTNYNSLVQTKQASTNYAK